MITAPASAQPAARRRWLRAVAGGVGRMAAALLVLDGLAAIGFALALAAGLSHLSAGLAAALPFLVLGVAAALLRGGGALAASRLGAVASGRARTALRRRVLAACLDLPAAARQSGELLAATVDEVEALDGYLARFLPARQSAGPVVLLVLAATAAASPVCAAILAATLLPFIAVMALAGGAAADESRRQFIALARLSGVFADQMRALPVVLALQAEQRAADRLGDIAEELRRRTMGVLRVAFVSSAGLEFFAALSVALVAVYAGFSLLGLLPFPAPERLDLGRAVFALALAPEFYAPMRRLAAAYHDRQAAETAADRLLALDAARRPAAPPPLPPLGGAPRIRFAAATVRYPGADRPALAPLDVEIAPGEMVALLGPSGAGKTTALHLLLGLTTLAGGEVWIDGHALSVTGPLAAAVSWLGQSPLIVPGSIAANIALARRDASRAEIAAAAQQAGCAALLAGRAGGLDAMLDERGGGLSGGELRRLALARALLKPAPILLLDEPTAHLDAAAEAALIATLRQAARGRTTLLATHSAALAAVADRVVHLSVDAGREPLPA